MKSVKSAALLTVIISLAAPTLSLAVSPKGECLDLSGRYREIKEHGLPERITITQSGCTGLKLESTDMPTMDLVADGLEHEDVVNKGDFYSLKLDSKGAWLVSVAYEDEWKKSVRSLEEARLTLDLDGALVVKRRTAMGDSASVYSRK